MLLYETIDPNNLTERDIEYLADMLSEILTEKHGKSIGSLSFSISVQFDFLEDNNGE
jgi:hypothetical protein